MRMERQGTALDEDIEVPRDPTGRNLLLVALAAVLAFGITFAAVKLRQHASPS